MEKMTSRKMSEILGRKMSEILRSENEVGKIIFILAQGLRPYYFIIPVRVFGSQSPHSPTPRGLPTVPPSQRLEMQIPFSLGPSAVLFYYPSEGVWVIVPPFPYLPVTAHCPTLPKYCYAGLCIILFIVHWCYTICKNFCWLNRLNKLTKLIKLVTKLT